MFNRRKHLITFITLIIFAASFRIAIAHWLPNDTPDDGRVYAQIARNLLEQHVYSHATEPPYDPTFIRLPGYPLFLAAIYSVFGHTSNGAVRIAQALIDTATCALIALIAFHWQPDEKRKPASAIAALAFAAACPFTAIYVSTILSEALTNFLIMATILAVTLAFRSGTIIRKANFASVDQPSLIRSLLWWCAAGVACGLAVLLRPDSGLFAIAIVITIAIAGVLRFRTEFKTTIMKGALFCFALIAVLAPWTIRNWQVFHLFQPLAPKYGFMPDEFAPQGYIRWLKTWMDDPRYINSFWWELNVNPIDIDDAPDSAFDSADERNRVAALFDRYNNADDTGQAEQQSKSENDQSTTGNAQAKPATKSGSTEKKQTNRSGNAGSNSNKTQEANDQNDESADQGNNDSDKESDNADESDSDDEGAVDMTPEIDRGFGQIASERIARHPLRYYLWTPAKRASTLWFDTHSDWYPFAGSLFPLEDLDRKHHQQIWLPLFALLVAIYTLSALAGAFALWESGEWQARIWTLLFILIVITRLAFLSSMHGPEPRYTVEFFPFLSVLAGIAAARWLDRLKRNRAAPDPLHGD